MKFNKENFKDITEDDGVEKTIVLKGRVKADVYVVKDVIENNPDRSKVWRKYIDKWIDEGRIEEDSDDD